MVGIFNTKSRYLLDVKKNANLYLKELQFDGAAYFYP